MEKSAPKVLALLENFVFENRKLALIALLGVLLVLFAFLVYRSGAFKATSVEVLDRDQSEEVSDKKLVVAIEGAVLRPGVYELLASDRLERLLILSGGLSEEADREWVARNINRAAKVVDGQKFYIPRTGESVQTANVGQVSGVSGVVGVVNINSGSVSELDSLPGVGAVRAQKIIEGRPYASVEELLTRKILPKSVFEEVKAKINI